MNISEEKVIQVLDQLVICKKQIEDIQEQTLLFVIFNSFDLTIWTHDTKEFVDALAKFLEVDPNNINELELISHNGARWHIHLSDENKASFFNPNRDLKYLEQLEELFLFTRKIKTLVDCIDSIWISVSGITVYFESHSDKEKLKIIDNMPKDVGEFKAVEDYADLLKVDYNYKGYSFTLCIDEK